ncbi:MAG: SDR family NAD(P)-dependent oxidoreductase, partial [Deltaproteobacteria bacterium]|nr:SDR family NAD(P)-dependent oxidoreductase [Deltaproteobacteria bacterium]
MEIKNTTAIITGGASGLGEATARALIRSGGRVALTDLNQEKGQALANELGDAATFFTLNVAQHEEVDAVV